jgi:hypothetical protein
MSQVTVISGVERRRRWSFKGKRALATAASAQGGLAEADVATLDSRVRRADEALFRPRSARDQVS